MSRKKKRRLENSEKTHKKERKKHSKKKRETSRYDFSGHLGMEDMLDLNKKIYPISYYLSDRTEMLNQMFMSLDWKHLRSMLPSSLKNASIATVKEFALRELLGMSNERIISVLNGQQLDSSSDSDVRNEDITVPSKIGHQSASRFALGNVSKIEEDSNESWFNGRKEWSLTDSLKLLGVRESENSSDLDTLEIGITPKEIGELLEDAPVKEDVNDMNDKEGKTLLEILELEMRARAIRALLKQQDDERPIKDELTGEVRKEYLHPSGDPTVLSSSNQAVASMDIKSSNPEKCNSSNSVFQSGFDEGYDLENMLQSASIGRNNTHKSLHCKSDILKCNNNFKEDENVTEMPSPIEFLNKQLPKQEILSGPEYHTECSWAARWFRSKDVQKVVSTSRMCAKIRKRMKLAKQLKPSLGNEIFKPEIIGSVNEYKRLGKAGCSSS